MAAGSSVTAAAAAAPPASPTSESSTPSTALSYSNSSSASSTGSFLSDTSCGDSESVGADSTIDEGLDYLAADGSSNSSREVRAGRHGGRERLGLCLLCWTTL